MMKLNLAILFLLLCCLVGAFAAHAQPQCSDHQSVVDMLANQFGEAKRGMGLSSNATLMELYANSKTGTWTIAITMASGMTCLLTAGDNFATVPEVVVKPGQPA